MTGGNIVVIFALLFAILAVSVPQSAAWSEESSSQESAGTSEETSGEVTSGPAGTTTTTTTTTTPPPATTTTTTPPPATTESCDKNCDLRPFRTCCSMSKNFNDRCSAKKEACRMKKLGFEVLTVDAPCVI